MKVHIGEITEAFYYLTDADENSGVEIPEGLYIQWCRVRDEWQRVQSKIESHVKKEESEP